MMPVRCFKRDQACSRAPEAEGPGGTGVSRDIPHPNPPQTDDPFHIHRLPAVRQTSRGGGGLPASVESAEKEKTREPWNQQDLTKGARATAEARAV